MEDKIHAYAKGLNFYTDTEEHIHWYKQISTSTQIAVSRK